MRSVTKELTNSRSIHLWESSTESTRTTRTRTSPFSSPMASISSAASNLCSSTRSAYLCPIRVNQGEVLRIDFRGSPNPNGVEDGSERPYGGVDPLRGEIGDSIQHALVRMSVQLGRSRARNEGELLSSVTDTREVGVANDVERPINNERGPDPLGHHFDGLVCQVHPVEDNGHCGAVVVDARGRI